ncbi:MAG: hypothetical protein ACRD9S_13530 [Pyrinomonadaceae bacterium]
MKSMRAFHFTFASLLLLGAFLAAPIDTRSQNTLPMDPNSPIGPKDYSECSTLQRQWDDLSNRLSRMHDDCVNSESKAGKKSNLAADLIATCQFPGCQAVHTRNREAELRKGPAVAQCRAEVGGYLEGERRRKEEEQRVRDENQRRAEENNRRIADQEAANRRAADAANQRVADQAAANRRAAENENQRIINSANERIARNQQRANSINSAITSISDSLIAGIEERRRERAAESEREEERIRIAEEREEARAERETARIAEEQRLAYEESARRAAEASARRAREGAYTRDIVESDIADRENAEANKNIGSDLSEQILAQMQLNASDADSIFGSDARGSISDIDLSSNVFVSASPADDSYKEIEPASGSSYRDIFRKFPGIDSLGDRFRQKLSDFKEQLPDLFVDETLDRLSSDHPLEVGNLTDKVYEYVVDHLWERGLEASQERYARLRATRAGEKDPDPVLLQYYRTEAAAHPVTGLWPQILRSGGKVPTALWEYYKNLIDKMANALGMASSAY